MVRSAASSITNMNQGNISINSIDVSIDFPTTTMESVMTAFQEIPLTALSNKTLWKLSLLLNSKKILRSEEGYERDWRGLASLSKQKFLCEGNVINGDDSITKVIQLWCTNNPKTATFAYLEHFLGIIDRWDVCDDIYENLVEDTKEYQKKVQLCLHMKSNENVDLKSVTLSGDFGHGSNSSILTTSDVIRAQNGLPPQLYDAFVLYADADLNYASEMLIKLEDNPEYNLKLCMKDRDLLAGVQFEHIALTQLIEERCKHLIVILTGAFLKSPENKFLVNYTQALQIQHKTRKIVPLLYEENVDIPRTLKIYTHLRYNSGTVNLFNFWSKLATSIQNVNGTADISTLSTSCYTNNSNNISALNSHLPNSTTWESVKTLSSPPAEISTTSVVQPDGIKKVQKKEKTKLKSLRQRSHKNNKDMLSNDVVLLSAHSTMQLHTTYQIKNTSSMSDLSANSICSDIKKKKWSTKILKKVFSRSNPKLQQA